MTPTPLPSRPRRAAAPATLAALAATFAARAALAQTPPDALAQAEAAYASIDFEAARARAREALEAGNHPASETARIYYLMGTASAALHDEAAAREAFLRMLALDPAMPVEQHLAPPLRASYIEARTYWSAEAVPFGAAVSAGADGLRITLTDPLRMARAALVRARVPPAQGFAVTRVPAAPTLEIPVAGARDAPRVEYVVRVLDEYGNQLVELGADASPRSLALAAPPTSNTTAQGPSRAWWRPAGWTAAGVGAAALVGAVVAWRVREARVEGWNSDDCLAGGTTREEACSARRLAGESAQAWSLVGLAAGGAFVAAGVALLVLAPSATSQARATGLACGPGPGTAGVACGLRF